jgi:hypothetical protein
MAANQALACGVDVNLSTWCGRQGVIGRPRPSLSRSGLWPPATFDRHCPAVIRGELPSWPSSRSPLQPPVVQPVSNVLDWAWAASAAPAASSREAADGQSADRLKLWSITCLSRGMMPDPMNDDKRALLEQRWAVRVSLPARPATRPRSPGGWSTTPPTPTWRHPLSSCGLLRPARPALPRRPPPTAPRSSSCAPNTVCRPPFAPPAWHGSLVAFRPSS